MHMVILSSAGFAATVFPEMGSHTLPTDFLTLDKTGSHFSRLMFVRVKVGLL